MTLPTGADVSPAKAMPRMATVGTAWFSTMSRVRPLFRTLRVVRWAKVPAAGLAADFVATAPPVGAGADARTAAGGGAGVPLFADGTNHPTVACSGTRYVAATRFTSAAVTALISST